MPNKTPLAIPDTCAGSIPFAFMFVMAPADPPINTNKIVPGRRPRRANVYEVKDMELVPAA